MHTSFGAEQLQDPTIARADAMLRRCVHCGLCTATCPTYVLLGDERDSPRGRIYMIKEMFETGKVGAPVTHHIDRCLSCLSCVTTCPSSVDYMHLVDLARTHIEVRGHRPASQRVSRRFLAAILPSPARFRVALLLAWLARPFRGILSGLGFKTAAAALDVAPPRPAASEAAAAQGRDPPRPGAGQARGAGARLRAGGAQALDQPGGDPAVAPPWRRGRARQGRGLLRRAGASSRPRGRPRRRRRNGMSMPGRARCARASSTPSSPPPRAAAP